MAHHWEEVSKTLADVVQTGWERRRVCTKCGAVQQFEADTHYMRIVGRRWRPPVGRCPADKKPSKDKNHGS